ncbi:DUF86 domain-containing protein [Sphingomonas koreensis]|nr:DUF86 domain-containing protein [Sphingomonas koreensis]TPG39901.1 DUF86 domain-containing protein [Sphingomonas koreensis]
MFSERERLYLSDIVDDADRLARFVDGLTAEDFAADEKTVLAVERLFQRITEAVIQIGTDAMEQVGQDIPVGRIRAFGNRLRHDYRRIDARIIFDTARDDIPPLRAAVFRALED